MSSPPDERDTHFLEGVEESGRPRKSHKLKIAGSNPASLTVRTIGDLIVVGNVRDEVDAAMSVPGDVFWLTINGSVRAVVLETVDDVVLGAVPEALHRLVRLTVRDAVRTR